MPNRVEFLREVSVAQRADCNFERIDQRDPTTKERGESTSQLSRDKLPDRPPGPRYLQQHAIDAHPLPRSLEPGQAGDGTADHRDDQKHEIPDDPVRHGHDNARREWKRSIEIRIKLRK